METAGGLILVLGTAAIVVWLVVYRWRGLGASEEPEQEGEWVDFLVRTYRGPTQEEVTGTFVEDAESLAARGYEPVSQSWGEGQWGGATFLLALLLCLFGIGILLLAYMAIVRPDGSLLVTYRLRSDG